MFNPPLTKKEIIIQGMLFLILIITTYFFIFDFFDQKILVTKSDDVYYFIEKYNIDIQYQKNAPEKVISKVKADYNLENPDLKAYVGGTPEAPIIFIVNATNFNYLLNHETGHIFWVVALSKKERNQYKIYYNQTNIFMRYWFWSPIHEINAEEHFAEAFRCYFEKWRTCYIGLTNDQKALLKNAIERAKNEN